MGLIRIENNTNSRIGITLSNGDHLNLTPKVEGKKGHISKPFPEELFQDTQSNNLLIAKGVIKIVPVEE